MYTIPPVATTRPTPHLSVMAPTNGWNTPQSRFWIANAKAKISLPQPNCVLIGFRNNPKLVRTPIERSTTTELHSKITNTVIEGRESFDFMVFENKCFFLQLPTFCRVFCSGFRRLRVDHHIPCRPCTSHRCSSDKSNNPGNYACDRLRAVVGGRKPTLLFPAF